MDASDITISIVVAVAENGVIGRNGELPWRLGSDLLRFRLLTMGHPLIMGRKTFDAIRKPFGGRYSIVVSRNHMSLTLNHPILCVASLEDALTIGRLLAKARGVKEAFVIGGAELFKAALPYAIRIYLTRVHGRPEGDVHWEPPFSDDWIEIDRKEYPASARDEFPVTDTILERR